MSLMSKLTAAYVAGIIDGEGSLSIFKRRKEECVRKISYSCRIRVGMSYNGKEIPEWLQKSFGGIITVRERANDGNAQDSYTWCLAGVERVKPFLSKIYPYLRLKRPQADVLNRFMKTFTAFNGKSFNKVKNVNPYQNATHPELKEKMFQQREELFQKMKALNKKGRIVQFERLSGTTLRGSDSPNL